MTSRQQLELLVLEMSRVTQLLEEHKQKGDIANVATAQKALRNAEWAFYEGDAASVEACIIELKGLIE